MLQEKEEQLLKKRMIELAGLCYQRDIQTSTGFLSLNEQTIFHSIEKTLPPVRTCLTGALRAQSANFFVFWLRMMMRSLDFRLPCWRSFRQTCVTVRR